MIIDARAATSALKALALTLFVWFAGLAALAMVVEPPVVAAFGASGPILADPRLRIVAMRPGVTLVAGEGRGWVRRLYGEGALFVWPIVGGGCFKPARVRE
jgi:hypothetical protein